MKTVWTMHVPRDVDDRNNWSLGFYPADSLGYCVGSAARRFDLSRWSRATEFAGAAINAAANDLRLGPLPGRMVRGDAGWSQLGANERSISRPVAGGVVRLFWNSCPSGDGDASGWMGDSIFGNAL